MTAALARTHDLKARQILAAWFSPAYPIGAYSYSHGLETAIERGLVRNGPDLHAWVEALVCFGAGRSDTILLAHAMAAEDPAAIAELAEALSPSAERLLETMAQGAAFARVTAAAWGIDVPRVAYPVAVGYAAGRLGLPLRETATLYLQSFAAAIVSAGVRLVPIGQTEGQQITVALMPRIAEVAEAAIVAPLEAVGGSALGADLMSLLHETQYTRLYRS